MLSTEQIEGHHIALEIACNPESPFYGRVKLDDLLALSLADQSRVWNTMSPKLKKMVATVIRDKGRD